MTESIYDSYALDDKAENDGQWVEFRGGAQLRLRSDTSLLVRRWTNARAKKQRQQLIAHGGVLPPEVMDKNEIAMCAEVLVVDWKGVLGRDGQPLACTKENIAALLTELPAMRREVLFASRVEETFRPEVQALGKTSATSSKPSSASTDESSNS